MDPTVGQLTNNKYRLVRLIGDGGMGSVFEARHELLGTTVALKFLHTALARRKGLVDRFLQEAQVSARIRSPHVVRVTDVERTPEGLAYMVMEYVEGTTLQERYEELYRSGKRLTYGEAFELMFQLLDGVGVAHQMGIVHRDLKPDNVMLTKDGANRTLVKILDFGIAKLRASGEMDRGLTKPGVVMGTPEYMAPEQAFSADKVDARADIFSLGVMFYEMLAGRRPVGGENAMAIAAQYLEGNVTQLRSLVPTIAPALGRAVHRAMASRPDQRFSSVGELRDAIAPFAPEGPGLPGGEQPSPETASRQALGESPALALALGVGDKVPEIAQGGDAILAVRPPSWPASPPHHTPAGPPPVLVAQGDSASAAAPAEGAAPLSPPAGDGPGGPLAPASLGPVERLSAAWEGRDGSAGDRHPEPVIEYQVVAGAELADRIHSEERALALAGNADATVAAAPNLGVAIQAAAGAARETAEATPFAAQPATPGIAVADGAGVAAPTTDRPGSTVVGAPFEAGELATEGEQAAPGPAGAMGLSTGTQPAPFLVAEAAARVAAAQPEPAAAGAFDARGAMPFAGPAAAAPPRKKSNGPSLTSVLLLAAAVSALVVGGVYAAQQVARDDDDDAPRRRGGAATTTTTTTTPADATPSPTTTSTTTWTTTTWTTTTSYTPSPTTSPTTTWTSPTTTTSTAPTTTSTTTTTTSILVIPTTLPSWTLPFPFPTPPPIKTSTETTPTTATTTTTTTSRRRPTLPLPLPRPVKPDG